MSEVLTRRLGPHQRPVAYYCAQLDLVAGGAPVCIRSAAAAAAIVEKSRPLVLEHPVAIHVPHEVELLLKQHAV